MRDTMHCRGFYDLGAVKESTTRLEDEDYCCDVTILPARRIQDLWNLGC